MGFTKRQFVTEAFEEAGLAAFVYDLTAEQMQSALRRLDAMLAAWNAKGIRLGYPIPSSPEDSDLDEETGVPDSANEAIYLNLAIRIAPGYGKVISPSTMANAKNALNGLQSISAKPDEMQITGLPRGAGGRLWRDNSDPLLDDPVDPLLAGDDDTLDFD